MNVITIKFNEKKTNNQMKCIIFTLLLLISGLAFSQEPYPEFSQEEYQTVGNEKDKPCKNNNSKCDNDLPLDNCLLPFIVIGGVLLMVFANKTNNLK